MIAVFTFAANIQSLWPYGFLSEFLNADKTEFHDGQTIPIEATDVIVDPLWNTASPIDLRLCTGGTTYANAINSASGGWAVRYQTNPQNELLADIAVAKNSWTSLGSGSLLNVVDASADGTCGPNSGQSAASGGDGKNTISFTNTLPSGIIAYTSLTYQTPIAGGQLTIVDADIEFSTAFDFVTGDCLAGSASSTCQKPSNYFSFRGILAHELGHFFGIAHSMINDDNSSDGTDTTTTMFPAISNLSQSRAIESLELDDQLAKLNAYPGTNFPTDTGGTISGNVYRSAGIGQRGAHVTAFALGAKKTLAGAYTAVNGVRASPDGSFTIKGLPLDIDFALFVEPVDRQDVHPNLIYSAYNVPIQAALSAEADGFKLFAVEGYPDAQVSDVRKNKNADASPGFSAATTFRLTSSVPSVTGIKFFLSQTVAAPNDAIGTTLAYASTGTVKNSNPLKIALISTTDLSVFTNPVLLISATANGATFDWSAGASSVTYSGTTLTVTVDPKPIKPASGTYTVVTSFADAKYLTVPSISANISIDNWTDNDADDMDESRPSTQRGGGGSCSLDENTKPTSTFGIVVLGLAFLTWYLLRKRISENRRLL